MKASWDILFDNYGTKRVSKTDWKKQAYVLTKRQVVAIESAGHFPQHGVEVEFSKIFEPSGSVRATYYHSKRKKVGRPPEPRLGKEIIRSWLQPGDIVLIGNIGAQLFVAKIRGEGYHLVDTAAAVATSANTHTKAKLMARAKAAKGKPSKKVSFRSDFVRDPNVVAGALIRAGGACEMPKCARSLFTSRSGSPYLEVHHIHMLSDGGDDTLENAAALCPHCHRELHYGLKAPVLMESLLAAIAAK